MNNLKKGVRVAARSVFEVDDSRLAIGTFSRPLLDDEARRFKNAWESEALPGFEDFQVDTKRVSFMTPPDGVPDAWKEIDRVLAGATGDVRKAS
ncbi:MAG: hypothetical protein ACRD00_00055 [Thermoanaerobaculia bacterium]